MHTQNNQAQRGAFRHFESRWVMCSNNPSSQIGIFFILSSLSTCFALFYHFADHTTRYQVILKEIYPVLATFGDLLVICFRGQYNRVEFHQKPESYPDNLLEQQLISRTFCSSIPIKVIKIIKNQPWTGDGSFICIVVNAMFLKIFRVPCRIGLPCSQLWSGSTFQCRSGRSRSWQTQPGSKYFPTNKAIFSWFLPFSVYSLLYLKTNGLQWKGRKRFIREIALYLYFLFKKIAGFGYNEKWSGGGWWDIEAYQKWIKAIL